MSAGNRVIEVCVRWAVEAFVVEVVVEVIDNIPPSSFSFSLMSLIEEMGGTGTEMSNMI